MKKTKEEKQSIKRLRFLCAKMYRRIRIPIISILLVLCTAGIAVASQSVSVSGNVISYTFSTTTSVNAKTCYLYILTNGANIVTYGSSSSSMPRSSHLSGSKSLDMTFSLSKGTNTSRLNYTSSNGGTKKIASKVVFDYTYSKGVFTATVTIYDPDPSVTGLAFVGTQRSGSSTYYYDINGTISISDAVYGMYHPTEATEPETTSDYKKNEENESRQQESERQSREAESRQQESERQSREAESRQQESEKQSREHESRKEDIKENISDIIGGGSSGGGTTGGGGSTGGGNSHRPPCVLKRILGHFSS